MQRPNLASQVASLTPGAEYVPGGPDEALGQAACGLLSGYAAASRDLAASGEGLPMDVAHSGASLLREAYFTQFPCLHACNLRDFGQFAHLYFSRCASASEKSRNKRKIANHKIVNGTRLLAHRSRSLRSRSLAHRVKYRCAATNSRKIQVCIFFFLLGRLRVARARRELVEEVGVAPRRHGRRRLRDVHLRPRRGPRGLRSKTQF